MTDTTTITTNAGDAGSMNYHRVDVALAFSLERLRKDLLVTSLITNYSEEARAQGSRFAETVRVPRRGEHTVKTKTPQSAATTSKVTDDKETLTIDTHKYIDFTVEDFGSLFVGNNRGYLTGTLQDAVDKLAETIETSVMALYTGASRQLGTAGAGASVTLIREIRRYSRLDKWPQTVPSYIVWGPYGEEDLLGQDLFVKANESGSDEALVNAFIGRKFGFEHFTSNMVPSLTGTPARESGMAFQSPAMGIAFLDMSTMDLPEEFRGQGTLMRALVMNDDQGRPAYSMRMTSQYDQDAMGTRVQVDTIYGVAVIRDEMLYEVRV